MSDRFYEDRKARHVCLRCQRPLGESYTYVRCNDCRMRYRLRRKQLAMGAVLPDERLIKPRPDTPSAKELIAMWHARTLTHADSPTEILI